MQGEITMNRKYKKSSWVGKLYKWTVGQHYDTDSCSVKKAVLWDAPIRLLFKQKLFYFSPVDENINTWFIWHTAIQIYVVANWGRLFVEEPTFIWLDVLVFPTLPFVGILTFIEAVAVVIILVGGILGIFRVIGQRVRGKVVTPIENRMRTIRTISAPVENYFIEWYDELKNKLCKPVTWVE